MEHQDFAKCKRCGGKCCMLYLDEEHGGMFDPKLWSFDAWVAAIHADRDQYGVAPLFDPIEMYYGDDALYASLLKKGIDPAYCEYRGRDGCMIPWAKRPRDCREYQCKDWPTI